MASMLTRRELQLVAEASRRRKDYKRRIAARRDARDLLSRLVALPTRDVPDVYYLRRSLFDGARETLRKKVSA